MPKHDITRLHMSARHLAMLQALLAEHVPQAQVWAYGSRVTGHAHAGSDLDIVLRNRANLNAETPGRAAIQEAVRASDLPMLVDIHDWAQLPEAFQREIARDYVQLQL